jgi:outer membrane protein assembly factor BamB
VVRRRALLLVLAGCSPAEREPPVPPPAWAYAPPAVAVTAAPIARIGRSQAPQQGAVRGMLGPAHVPLRAATPTSVPGGDKARVVLYGVEGVQSAVELVDIDAGRVVWRDTTACAGPVVGVTEDAIVCADAKGVRGVGMDGKARWKIEAAYLAMSDDRVVIEGPGEAIVVDAASGDELTRVKLPANVMADSVLASCGDAGRELFAQGQDGTLVRVADVKGKVAVAWGVAVGKIDELEACTGSLVLVREAGALLAIDRATGKLTGRVDGVRGSWKARDGSDRIEVATAAGVIRVPRDLSGEGESVLPLVLGELIDARGEQRLVRAAKGTAVVLDRAGVRAYLGFAAMSGALGDNAIVRASWNDDDLPRRIAIPERYRKTLRLSAERPGVALPAELRDLPTVVEAAAAIEARDRAAFGVLDIALDDTDESVVYALTAELANEETNAAGIAAADLATKTWRWTNGAACDRGEAVRMAVAREVIVCASRTRAKPAAQVRAIAKDGNPRWAWETDRVRDLAAAGDAVLVFDADVVTVLDAVTGKPRWRITSSDGGPAIATAITFGTATFIVAIERGHVVARTIAGWPIWSIAIDGHARAVQAAGAGVLVELEDGDAYRIELPTGTVHAMPGLNLAWQGAGDLVIAHTAGGPVPGQPPAPPLRVLKPILEKKKKKEPKAPTPADHDPERPRLWTPIPPPPALGDSVQVTLYEPTGGLRARNDYGLGTGAGASVARARGPAGSPIVVYVGRDILSIDPRTGDPIRRVLLPEDAPIGLVFGTIVDGTPVAGAVLATPLRIVLF